MRNDAAPRAAAPRLRHVHSVADVTHLVQRAIRQAAPAPLWIEAELSGVRQARTGTLYLTLRGHGAEVDGVVFPATLRRLPVPIHDGLKVVVLGRLDLYPERGRFQIIIEDVEPQGLGSQELRLREVIARLERAGMLRPERKRPRQCSPG